MASVEMKVERKRRGGLVFLLAVAVSGFMLWHGLQSMPPAAPSYEHRKANEALKADLADARGKNLQAEPAQVEAPAQSPADKARAEGREPSRFELYDSGEITANEYAELAAAELQAWQFERGTELAATLTLSTKVSTLDESNSRLRPALYVLIHDEWEAVNGYAPCHAKLYAMAKFARVMLFRASGSASIGDVVTTPEYQAGIAERWADTDCTDGLLPK